MRNCRLYRAPKLVIPSKNKTRKRVSPYKLNSITHVLFRNMMIEIVNTYLGIGVLQDPHPPPPKKTLSKLHRMIT